MSSQTSTCLRLALFLVLLVPARAFADLTYLDQSEILRVLQDIRAPTYGSAADNADLNEAIRVQRASTAADCRRALRGMSASLEDFYGVRVGQHEPILSPAELEEVRILMNEVYEDVDTAVHILKRASNRLRPHLRGDSRTRLCPGVPANYSVGTSFPSGHAAIGYLQGLVLSEVFTQSDRKSAIMRQALQIGRDRVVLGVHHPRDIEAGVEIANRTFLIIKEKPAFVASVSAARARVVSAAKVDSARTRVPARARESQ